jgi:hypothetical protein
LYEVAPARLFYGQVREADGRLEKQARIRRTDGKPLLVRKVSVTDSRVTATARPEADGGASLTLVLSAASVKDALWGEVILETDHPHQPVLKIPYAATARKGE